MDCPWRVFSIIPGVEVTTAEGHLLCVGTTLPDAARLKGRPARDVCTLIHEHGGRAIPPHPYDLFRAGIRFATLETLPIDALEVFFNAATTLRRYNTFAFRYAQLRGLPMTAASDAHHAAAVGTAYTILNCEELSVKSALAQILKSNELNQRYLTPRDSMRKDLEQLVAFTSEKTSRYHFARRSGSARILRTPSCILPAAHASRVAHALACRFRRHRRNSFTASPTWRAGL